MLTHTQCVGSSSWESQLLSHQVAALLLASVRVTLLHGAHSLWTTKGNKTLSRGYLSHQAYTSNLGLNRLSKVNDSIGRKREKKKQRNERREGEREGGSGKS